MPNAYMFTTKQMAEVGGELVCTQQLINELRATTPQMILFWVKGK